MVINKKTSWLALILTAGILIAAGCAAPSQDDVAEAFISYTLAVPTASETTLDTATTGTVFDTYTNVAEATYGYTFNGLTKKDYDGTAYIYTGTLTLTGGKIAVLLLDYSSAAGVLSGTITGDETAIDVSTVVLPAEE